MVFNTFTVVQPQPPSNSRTHFYHLRKEEALFTLADSPHLLYPLIWQPLFCMSLTCLFWTVHINLIMHYVDLRLVSFIQHNVSKGNSSFLFMAK